MIGIIRSDETLARLAQDWDNPRVIGKTHAVWAVAPVVVIVLLGAVAAFATGVAGGAYFGTSPAVVASLGVGAITTAAIGHATRRSNRAVGLAIVAAGWSVGVYLLVFGLARLAYADSGPSLLASTLARLVMAGHVPPLTLFVVTGLLTRRSLIGERHPGLPLIASIGLAAISFVAIFTLADPGVLVAGVSPVFQVPYPVLIGALILNHLWLATLLLPPVLLIWARRAAGGQEDPRRLATAAIASLVPVCQLLLCTLLGFAGDASGIAREGGATLLIVGLGAAWPLTAVGFGLAVRGPGMPYTVSPGVLARAASLVLGVMTAMIAICAGLLISLGHGLGTTVVIAIAVVVVALALRPLAVRVLAALMGEPAPIQSNGHSPGLVVVAPNRSRLSLLTRREREVLRLLAAGLSNAGIAAQLVLSERTIDAHLRSVFDKLDLPDSRDDNRRVQAAAVWAQESGEQHVPEPELTSKLG